MNAYRIWIVQENKNDKSREAGYLDTGSELTRNEEDACTTGFAEALACIEACNYGDLVVIEARIERV